MMLPQIQFKNHPILGDLFLDFTSKSGKPYSKIFFVGENACGKTTILNELYNYKHSEYIINKVINYGIVNHNAQPVNSSFKAIMLDYDFKYKIVLDEISKNISGKHLFKNNNFNNYKLLLNLVLKPNKFNNTNELLDELKVINNSKIDNFFHNEYSNEDITKYVSEFIGITEVKNHKNLFIDKYCSGEQELILKLNYIKENLTLDIDYILIDEIETGLHPKWQLKIIDIINECVKFRGSKEQDVQFFIATHSENILKGALLNDDALIIHLLKENDQVFANRIDKMSLVLPYKSFSEIQYLVFKIPSIEYHNELYAKLQSDLNLNSLKNVDDHILYSNFFNAELHLKKYIYKTTEYHTISTYIRNVIHHPESNYKFTDNELETSINLLREILLKYKLVKKI